MIRFSLLTAFVISFQVIALQAIDVRTRILFDSYRSKSLQNRFKQYESNVFKHLGKLNQLLLFNQSEKNEIDSKRKQNLVVSVVHLEPFTNVHKLKGIEIELIETISNCVNKTLEYKVVKLRHDNRTEIKNHMLQK